MKKLQELAERSDYVNATKELKQACIDVAGVICSKMQELDQKSLCINGHDYNLQTQNASGYSETFFTRNGQSLETKNFYYYAGNFNCPVRPAINSEFVDFANDLMTIVNVLDEIETKKTKDARCDAFFQFYQDWKNYQETQKQLDDLAKKEEKL